MGWGEILYMVGGKFCYFLKYFDIFLKIVGFIPNLVWIFQKQFECLPEFFNAGNIRTSTYLHQLSNIYIGEKAGLAK